MMSLDRQRAFTKIKEEFQDISSNSISEIGVSVGLVNNNLFEWQSTLIGPADSGYKNGLFFLRIKFPDNYPQAPPDVRFLNPVYHANVNPRIPRFIGDDCLGHVSISILKQWRPEYTIKEVLTNIFSLFYLEYPENAYDPGRIYEMRTDYVLHEEKKKYFTRKYANPGRSLNVSENADWDFSISEVY